MELFSTRFYAIVSLVITIISLAITVSAAHAQKASIGKPSPLSEAHKSMALKGNKPDVATPSMIAPSTASPSIATTAKTAKPPRCQGLISADFTSMGRSANKLNAIRAWRKKVVSAYGEKYKHWSVSQGHQVSCSKGAGKARCTASARPCRIIKWNMKKAPKVKQGI